MTARILEFEPEEEFENEIESRSTPHRQMPGYGEAVAEAAKYAREHGEPEIEELKKIREIVEANWWKSEKFEDRIDDLSKALDMDPALIRQAIVSAVTPECLVSISTEDSQEPLAKALKDKDFETYCLLRVLKEKGFDISVWTLGDEDWQREKFRLSGADKFIRPDHVFVAEGSKIDKLREILDKQDPSTHVYVVDDNPQRLSDALALRSEYESRAVQIHDYQIKIKDKNADATAFYQWILKEREKNPNPVLVMDFDQTIAETDGALSGQACENILRYKLAPPRVELRKAA
ncbi:MAG: hypothetical protein A3I07_02580 [Candidatus Doudnabacteria bacterium RIFCSPLOWO2_02_FULL_42_9]|uniref:Uncharacterized protein n=1 Tax=Candidatus Doudnabacteria bacterium RIFCSPHIGHO2_01_FULL_41_86 TaxID=1817821 RepID=A0A1F5N9R8_9BACT|nr:MAG: hypothetical protein A2717_02110 [Candidatus Doudnabacteria bacterium RIFCSPHIGHO2_01_FULL_41_86]OGE75561.1 MAG: hypothetical protein A3K07_01865 [Candidatus Doudnabacteria bacterium RIFCSPHIGHO2_01_43_10]OGE85357.1 MAG: hypothetical protein A3E28_01680 [Candidatus Doudnabacteria bacterium RIFCSPHIGHO2_12_FULL_42_22]OGE86895.1 MAG: hypothetical protein A3C49_02515 [Candidatus Doudnabacteria bacterium RIFCSPHIGHO2_02_FULL_42_25]OGE92494.1 MAG: hypothetical protein A2895_02670 [Candidatus